MRAIKSNRVAALRRVRVTFFSASHKSISGKKWSLVRCSTSFDAQMEPTFQAPWHCMGSPRQQPWSMSRIACGYDMQRNSDREMICEKYKKLMLFFFLTTISKSIEVIIAAIREERTSWPLLCGFCGWGSSWPEEVKQRNEHYTWLRTSK